MEEMMEKVARAIAAQPTSLDGDCIATHLATCLHVRTAPNGEEKDRIMSICRDAALAAITFFIGEGRVEK